MFFLICFIYSVSYNNIFRFCLSGVALRYMPRYIFNNSISIRNVCFSRAKKSPDRGCAVCTRKTLFVMNFILSSFHFQIHHTITYHILANFFHLSGRSFDTDLRTSVFGKTAYSEMSDDNDRNSSFIFDDSDYCP